MREGGKEVNTHLFPEMVGGANEVNYMKMLWKTSNVIKKNNTMGIIIIRSIYIQPGNSVNSTITIIKLKK